jgi:hypothetical protein
LVTRVGEGQGKELVIGVDSLEARCLGPEEETGCSSVRKNIGFWE